MEIMIRVGACDEFGQRRTAQFWEAQQIQRAFGQWNEETEYFDFAVSGHPLELYADIAWDTYCPVSRMGEHIGDEIVTCGLIVEQRMHHQVTGEPMKFLTLADWTGMVETELFAATYQTYGLATVRYPVLEITARVEPFENCRGFTLRVLRAAKPRMNAHY
jgi:DNA polymerase III alpha subunit